MIEYLAMFWLIKINCDIKVFVNKKYMATSVINSFIQSYNKICWKIFTFWDKGTKQKVLFSTRISLNSFDL